MNVNELKNIFGECKIEGDKIVINNNLHDFIKYIYINFSFKLLKSITAIDTGNGIELIYRLYSVDDEENLLISILVKNEAETITDIFESAIADENEIYDLFGINFIGNDNLKRLYMPENWEGFPLRKDYIEDDTRLAWNDDDDKNA